MVEKLKVIASVIREGEDSEVFLIIRGRGSDVTIETNQISPSDDRGVAIRSQYDLIADLPSIAMNISLHHAAFTKISTIDVKESSREVVVSVFARAMKDGEGRFVIYTQNDNAPSKLVIITQRGESKFVGQTTNEDDEILFADDRPFLDKIRGLSC
jgi:hypothetical protein